MEKLLYTRSAAAEALSISTDKLDELTQRGVIKRVNIGARVYFDPHDLLTFVGRLKAEGGIA